MRSIDKLITSQFNVMSSSSDNIRGIRKMIPVDRGTILKTRESRKHIASESSLPSTHKHLFARAQHSFLILVNYQREVDKGN